MILQKSRTQTICPISILFVSFSFKSHIRALVPALPYAICWHILPLKHKKHALSGLLIVNFFVTLLQYHRICMMVLQQACINFLLIYSLSFISCLPLCLSVSHISLSHFSSSLSVAVQLQSHFVSPSPSCLSFSHFSSSLSVAMQPKTSLVCLRSAWWWGGWRG